MARGWCELHYYRWMRQGDPLKLWTPPPHEPSPCSVEGCEEPAKALGLCGRHYLLQHKRRNREHVRKRDRAWRAANRDRVLDYAMNYHAQKIRAWVEDVERLIVFERDQGICGICGLPADRNRFHVDHVIPLSRGGEHSYANTQAAHPSCNQAKGDKLPRELPVNFAALLRTRSTVAAVA